MNVHPVSINDQLLRQTRAHHVQLSAMADNKANILITTASLVVTFTLPQLADGSAGWPQMALVAGCVVTIMLAAWAVMPKIRPPRTGAATQVDDPNANLLFFGDFAGMNWKDYEAAMETILNDSNRGYQAMVKEVYLLGLYLAHRKYRYLRLAYFSFLASIITGGLGMVLQRWWQ